MTEVRVRCIATSLLVVIAAMMPPLLLADAATQARLDSIERKLDSRGLLDMLNRVEQMQRDVQQLRGDIEMQTHTLKEVQRRSREQYLDIDRRLQQLETGQTISPSVPSVPLITDSTQTPPVPVMGQRPSPAPTSAPTSAPISAQVPPAGGAGERADYDKALAILREGRYAEASRAFSDFLANYPSSGYADNAGYWLGETYYVDRDFDKALAAFKGLVDNYPDSPKVSDSLLKTGYIYYEQQSWSAARQALEAVVNGYPETTAARLANDRLRRMKKEGH